MSFVLDFGFCEADVGVGALKSRSKRPAPEPMTDGAGLLVAEVSTTGASDGSCVAAGVEAAAVGRLPGIAGGGPLCVVEGVIGEAESPRSPKRSNVAAFATGFAVGAGGALDVRCEAERSG